MAINRIAGLNAHAGACGTDRIEVMRRHDCVASLRFGEKTVETPAGSCKYSGRPARSNVIIAPSSTRRSAGYAEMLMNTTEKLSRRLFPCVRDVGASVVKIFCRYIYGASPIQSGIKATRGSRSTFADTSLIHSPHEI